jgi:hypothetical protein
MILEIVKVHKKGEAMKKMMGMLFVFAMLAGCNSSVRESTWQEDVQLQDGSVMTLTRHAKYEGAKELIREHYGLSWYSIDFEHPATKEPVHWESKILVSANELVKAKAENQEVRPRLTAIALMMKDSDLYLLADPSAARSDLGCPDPRYVLFKWEKKHWVHTDLDQIPYRSFAANVLADLNGVTDILRIHDNHLPTQVTSKQKINYKPFLIDLNGMTKQIFDEKNCGLHGRDWLKSKPLAN